MTDHYAVVGNPIGHSKSPIIHRLFAEQSGQDMEYRAELGDLCDFEEQVADWFKSDLRGLNVTLPFKERALALATKKTSRAVIAGASNTLRFNSKTEEIEADNTDGVGLMRDLQDRLGIELKRKRILILGAGGATTWRKTGGGADANGTSGTSYYNMGRYASNVLAKQTA
jgi:shikimate dehydrogenase